MFFRKRKARIKNAFKNYNQRHYQINKEEKMNEIKNKGTKIQLNKHQAKQLSLSGNFKVMFAEDEYSLKELKQIGINSDLIRKISFSNLIDLNEEKYILKQSYSNKEIALIIDMYLGTILNKFYTPEMLKQGFFYIKLPQELLQLSVEYNLTFPHIIWKKHRFQSFVGSHNLLFLMDIKAIKKSMIRKTPLVIKITD